MNYKLFALLLTLTLAATPAMQAMRATRSLLATARSLRPAAQAGKQALARTHSTNSRDHGNRQEEPRHGYDNYYIPAAVTAGVVLTAQNDMEEEEYSAADEKLDITDIKAVQKFLKNATSEEQQAIAKAISQNIQNYTSSDFIMIVSNILNEHNKEILIPALVQTITHNFKEYGIFIPMILPHVLHHSSEENQATISTCIAKNIFQFDPEEMDRILEVLNEQNKVIVIIAYIQDLFNTVPKGEDINSLFEKSVWFFVDLLLKLDRKENKTIIFNEIIKKDIPELQDFLTEQNPKTVTALMQNMHKLKPAELLLILAISTQESKHAIQATIHQKIEEFIGQSDIESQSTAHIKHNAVAAWIDFIKIMNDQTQRAVFQQALQHEQTIPHNTAAFYHSQRSPVYWLELLYTKLWETKYNQKTNNYLFTRFPDDQTLFANAILQADGHQKRAEVMKIGRQMGEDELRPYLLFANYALLANGTEWGSSTAHYQVNNFNIGDPEITTQNIVNKFSSENLFETYKTELEQLEAEFKKIVPGSVLLQLIMPQDMLKDHVYLAEPFGIKKKLTISGQETDDVATIINTLKTAPSTMDNSDRQEFCFVMTPDTVHTLREQGAEVRVYGDFDQEKLNALTLKLEALLARIAQENPTKFSGGMTPTQSYQAYKPVLNDLLQKKT